MAMIFEREGDSEKSAEMMADFWGPGHIDQFIRQAVQYCWMALPKEKRTLEEVEKQIHRLVERALRDYREDQQAFGRSP